jgi:hypothetical protein
MNKFLDLLCPLVMPLLGYKYMYIYTYKYIHIYTYLYMHIFIIYIGIDLLVMTVILSAITGLTQVRTLIPYLLLLYVMDVFQIKNT